jgi:hypothetical protein
MKQLFCRAHHQRQLVRRWHSQNIVESINTHIANLSATVLMQSTASNNANTAIFNASMQQGAANKAQCNSNHNCMMQQFAMMLTTSPIALFAGQPTSQPASPQAVPILARAQQWGQLLGKGRGSTRSCNGCGHCNLRSLAQQGAPIPFVGGNHMIPYILVGMQPKRQQNAHYSNVVKQWANQNVCFDCGFDVEYWHTSATCPWKKVGHMEGFTCSDYLEYKRANHQFCCKVMHKTMYPNM